MPADWYDLAEDALYGDPWERCREPERFDTLAAPLDTVTDWPTSPTVAISRPRPSDAVDPEAVPPRPGSTAPSDWALWA